MTVVLLFTLSLFSRSASVEAKGAVIRLHAKWQNAPLLLETVEFLADEDTALVGRFAAAWQQGAPVEGQGCWERILRTAGQLLTPATQQMLPVALGARQYSARVEAFRSLAEEAGLPLKGACCFVDMAGQRAASTEELAALLAQPAALEALANATPALHRFDHVVGGAGGAGGGAGAPQRTAVLYGTPAAACFADMLAALDAAAQGGAARLAYAVRPLALEGCEVGLCGGYGQGGPLQLAGYGVELALKNMEYKAMDEKDKEAAAASAAEGGDDGPQEVAGLLFGRLVERAPLLREPLLALRERLHAAAAPEEALKVWDLKDLGLQAAQRAARAERPLQALREVSQGFVTLAPALSRERVDFALRAEIAQNQQTLQGGASALLVNGVLVDLANFDLYAFLDTLRKEVRLMEQLQASGLQARDIAGALRLRPQAAPLDASEVLVDLRSDSALHWLNNLEAGRQYWGWSTRLADLLRPQFSGALHQVARNLYSLVAVVDPGRSDSLELIALLHHVCSSQWPVRAGVLLLPGATVARVRSQGAEAAAATPWEELGVGEHAARAFLALEAVSGAPAAWKFLTQLSRAAAAKDGGDLTTAAVERAFKSAWAEQPSGRTRDLTADQSLDQLAAGEGIGEGLAAECAAAAAFGAARGVGDVAPALWLNGALTMRPAGVRWQQLLGFAVQMEQQRLQEAIYYGRIKDEHDDILARVLSVGRAVKRHSPRLLAPAVAQGAAAADPAAPLQVALVGPLSPWVEPWARLGYLHFAGSEEAAKGCTHWLVADFGSKEGRELLAAGLEYLADESSEGARVSLLHSPAAAGAAPPTWVRAALAAMRLPSRRPKIASLLRALLQLFPDGDASEEDVLAAAEEAGLNHAALVALLQDVDGGLAVTHASIAAACREQLGIAAGAAAVVTNGRVLVLHDAALGTEDGASAEDLSLLQMVAESSQLSNQVATLVQTAREDGRTLHAAGSKAATRGTGAAVEEAAAEAGEQLGEEWTSEQLSDAALLLSSVLAAHAAASPPADMRQAAKISALVAAMPRTHSGFASAPAVGEGGLPGLEIWAVLDPLSRSAQRTAPLLEFLERTLRPSIQVHMNPVMEVSDLPLKSFYRYALPGFAGQPGELPGAPNLPAAAFVDLPAHKVLTLNMDVPEPWLVEPVQAPLDLDNLHLADLGAAPALEAGFELEALLLTGSCVDIAAASRNQVTPRGVQLHLGTPAQPRLVDTLVMSNLGYFQLKAAPGVFVLRLAPGRSADLYVVDNSTDGAVEDHTAQVVIDSLSGRHMMLQLRKRKGFEAEDVLDQSNGEANGSLWGRMTSWLAPGQAAAGVQADGGTGPPRLSAEEDPDAVHIFTIASGHMYERLQKIMILSVLRNTKSRTKFWFIKNYMSPQFKRFLPHMAQRYGFEYELVTYKWPTWLHKQTEKQRIIWAYKILFLDVLFPLSLRKVIFADSDQISRADFADLWKLDMQGAPYGYTPFCETNREMDGFRFWKQGFWKDHLQGRPYHISALYVVDLARFRQMAAGDQLRVVYDQLSRDPASLSNLDQDLPNYAQHQVPIFSLPQEWLWCETWCGNLTKAAAKTIDLCNNPLTKEPKLAGARRIVAEWPALDAEVGAFTAQVEAERTM
ncbi:hypothetical protein WJX81_007880 [Elliptochloris bilobata]|uniref:UDP-glucose:glycoprotein glucosyltransferase n=1 Tax=Elliptochloris bilobata TaxID=381761 RepID=A0AAW1RBK0_9CHLO